MWVKIMNPNTRLNPVVIVGGLIIVVTGVVSALVDVSLQVLLLQAPVPLVIGIGLFTYGLLKPGRAIESEQRTVIKWTLFGLVAFTTIGYWFTEMSVRPDTAIPLSIVASLAVGAALGTVTGVYAARIHQTNEELKETLAELEQVNERLTIKNEQLDQFVDVASHDLRNPVNVAQGHLEMVREERNNEHLEEVDTALTRMDMLITDLVSLAKSGKQIDEIDPVNLGKISRSAWSTVETKDTSLTVASNMEIYADESRVKQLLENMFRNAIQHGGEDVVVTVGTLKDGFYVEDDGAGISDNLRGRVLDSGVTTANGGTGLGLTIIKQIADAHGWQITVERSAENGARFELTGVEVPE